MFSPCARSLTIRSNWSTVLSRIHSANSPCCTLVLLKFMEDAFWRNPFRPISHVNVLTSRPQSCEATVITRRVSSSRWSYTGIMHTDYQNYIHRRLLQTFDASRTLAKGKRFPLRDQTSDDIEQIMSDYEDVVREFAELLQCHVELVQQMVRRDTRLVTHFPKVKVIAKIKLLLNHGFDGKEITVRYQLFSRSIGFLRSRLKIMESVKRYRHHLSLLLLSNVEFQHRIDTYRQELDAMGDHPSPTSFIAHLLGSTGTEINSLVQGGCYHLLTMRPSRLRKIVQILQLYGVSLEEMRTKCNVLKCLPDIAKTRLQLVQDAGVYHPDKLVCILLSSESQFQSSLERWRRCAEALGILSDKREMLKQRLNCSDGDINNMLIQAPAMGPLSAAKLADNLDILLKVIGISPSSVVHHPALLFFSTTRLLSRWAILEHLSLTEYELIRALILSERKFLDKFESRSATEY